MKYVITILCAIGFVQSVLAQKGTDTGSLDNDNLLVKVFKASVLLNNPNDGNLESALADFKSVGDLTVSSSTPDETKIIVGYACRLYATGLMMQSEDMDNIQIINYLNKAHLKSGDAYSEYLLGVAYYDTEEEGIHCISQDKNKGMSLLMESARKGCICALEEIAEIYMEEGDEDKAMEYHIKAASITPVDVAASNDVYSNIRTPNPSNNSFVMTYWNRALYNAGNCYLSEGDYEAALPFYKKFTQYDMPDYLLSRAWCYILSDEHKLALDDYNTALELFPKNGKVYNALAVSSIKYWNKREDAIRYFKKAIELGYAPAEHNYKEYILGE